MGHNIIGSLIEVHKGFNKIEGQSLEYLSDRMIFDLAGEKIQKLKDEDIKIELENDMAEFRFNPALFVEKRWLKFILRNADEDRRLNHKLAEEYFEKEKYDSLDEIERMWGYERNVEYIIFKTTFPDLEPVGNLEGRPFASYCIGVEQTAPIFYKHVEYRLKNLKNKK